MPPPTPELRPIDKAVGFLRDALVPDAVPAVHVAELAKQGGISARTLRRCADLGEGASGPRSRSPA
jgi:hypothetical protein